MLVSQFHTVLWFLGAWAFVGSEALILLNGLEIPPAGATSGRSGVSQSITRRLERVSFVGVCPGRVGDNYNIFSSADGQRTRSLFGAPLYFQSPAPEGEVHSACSSIHLSRFSPSFAQGLGRCEWLATYCGLESSAAHAVGDGSGLFSECPREGRAGQLAGQSSRVAFVGSSSKAGFRRDATTERAVQTVAKRCRDHQTGGEQRQS